jgi:hypothetical protein
MVTEEGGVAVTLDFYSRGTLIRSQTVLSKVSSGFFQSLQKNAGIVAWLGCDWFQILYTS